MHRITRAIFIAGLAALLALGAAHESWAAPPAKTRPAAAAVEKDALEGFDAFVAEVMKAWKVPGVAVAIVKDGQVILLKGYGYRDVEKQLPVTPQTLFAIGSITKSFTVTAMGMLVDEGKLEWDRPVREFLPEFRLNDPVASERMTPRDLVTHRSGLPRHDLLWYNAGFTRREMVERLRYLEPSKDFRSTYQYNNLMFMTAGYLVGQRAGMSWEDFVRRRIFQPLAMTSSNFSVRDSEKSPDFAQPYEKVKEEVKLVPFRVIDEIAPAGSINSSADAMSRYLLMHSNGGQLGEQRLLSDNNSTQMQSPQMVIPGWLRFKEVGHSSYGMAFTIGTYRGLKTVAHGGAIDGFLALLTFMPQEKIGAVVLTNLGSHLATSVLAYNIYDRLLGLQPVDWEGRFKEMERKGEESEEEAKKKGYTPRREGTTLSHAIADYAGEYEHPGYGIATVALKDGGLELTYNNFPSPLQHFHYDVFEVKEDPLNPLEKMKVLFSTSVNGDIDSLNVALEPNTPAIAFRRLPDRRMRERSFLEPLAGDYELGATTVTVTLKGENTLMFIVPGQPPYELLPQRGLLFDLKGLTGFSIEFHKDDSGKVTELVAYQPNGTFVGKRKAVEKPPQY
ncbi:MAG: serine hydrolase [Candidatus Acidiferrales bacterium]